MNCVHCNGTGKTPGFDYLDCVHCDAATERAELEAWARLNCARIAPDDLWTVYQHGKQAKDCTTRA